jgi:hypothetical protein
LTRKALSRVLGLSGPMEDATIQNILTPKQTM